MPHRPLGTSELVVSVVGWSTRALSRPSPVSPAALIRAALDAQIDLFDTWPEGEGQDTLVRVLRGQRRHVTLGARCVAGGMQATLGRPDLAWRPGEVRHRLEAALRRLQRDWVDLWLLHHPPPDAVADDDLWAQLVDDRAAGWVRAVGVATEVADDAGAVLAGGHVDALVMPLPLDAPEPGRRLAVEAAERGVAFLADDPLGDEPPPAHLLSGLLRPDTDRTEAQGTLAAVLSLPGLTSVVTPASTPETIAEHAEAAMLPLEPAEGERLVARLDEARGDDREP